MHNLETVCPHCNTAQPLITSVMDDDEPINGDRVMCFKCGKFGIFEEGAFGKIRKPTRPELKSIAADQDCRKMVMLWAMHSR